jgi:hypothetical protein
MIGQHLGPCVCLCVINHTFFSLNYLSLSCNDIVKHLFGHVYGKCADMAEEWENVTASVV